MKTVKKVNLFLIGAAKCGTTSLFRYFEQHPSFYTTMPKEPRFFAHDINEKHRLIKTREEYDDLYRPSTCNHEYLVDGSPAYMYSSVAAEEIYNYNPNAKLVVMLRPPADLVYSVHSQYLWSCDENIEDFEQAWRLSEDRKKGSLVPRDCSNPQVLIYDEFASLGAQIERYLKIFSREQIYPILFDDFKDNSKACFVNLLDYLNVPWEDSVDFTPRNLNTKHRSKLLSMALHGKIPGVAKLKALLNSIGILNTTSLRSHLMKMNNKVIKREPLPSNLRLEIEHCYEEDVQKLESLLELDLSSWRTL